MAGSEGLQLRAYLYVAGAASLWGGMGVLAKMLYAEDVSPWTLVFYRSLLGFLACGALILLLNREWFSIRRQDLPFLVMYGLVSTSAFFALYLYTISLATVAVAAVLLYTSPVFSAIMGKVFYGEPLTPAKMAALGLSFVGCFLVTGLQGGELAVGILGIATGIGSAITYATFGIMGKHARRRYGSLTILFYTMGFGSLFLLPVLTLPGASIGPFSSTVWALLAVMAIGPTLIARILFVAAVKHIEASRAAIVATVEPVVAAVLATLVLGEILSPTQTLGGALVLVGSVLAQQTGGRQAASQPEATTAAESRAEP